MSVVPIRRGMAGPVRSGASRNDGAAASIGDLVVATVRRLKILQREAELAGRADIALNAECCAAMIESCDR